MFRVRLIKARVGVNFIKVVNVQGVFRRFVLNDVIFPENLPDIFADGCILGFFNDQYVNLQRLFAKQMLRFDF